MNFDLSEIDKAYITNAVTIAALAISLSEIEQLIRIIGLFAALVFTCIQIYKTLKKK